MPKYSYYLFILFTLSGCATTPSNNTSTLIVQHSTAQRETQLAQIKKWQLHGKIAFIEQHKDKKGKRESAAIIWRVNNINQTQELSLTSYFGINVLYLGSKKNQHLIKVEGKEYHTNNLTQLVHSLTGLTLPTKALSFWLKGLAYQSTDHLEYSPTTQLPLYIKSYYDNVQWQINYSRYQVFDGVQMATKFTIKTDDLFIKIAVKEWSLIN